MENLLLTLDPKSTIRKKNANEIRLIQLNLLFVGSRRIICTELSYLIRSTGWYLCMTP